MGPQQKSINLFWWSEPRLMGKPRENYGDLLSKYVVEKISGKQVKWVHPKKQAWYKWNKKNYVTVGSIIHHASKDSIVWGSGIIDREQKIVRADFRAVRGPHTRKFLQGLGHKCPKVYGDPALLLPQFFAPGEQKKYKIGIIPHYHDFKQLADLYKKEKNILVIDLMTSDVEAVTRQILQCEKTVSSSLHGIIVSHAYRIPSIWVEFSKKLFGDGIKYRDYLESVGLPFYRAAFLTTKRTTEELGNMFNEYPVLPEKRKVKELQKGLMRSCPFIE